MIIKKFSGGSEGDNATDRDGRLSILVGLLSLCIVFNSTLSTVVLSLLGVGAIQGFTSRVFLVSVFVLSIACVAIWILRQGEVRWDRLFLGICAYALMLLSFLATRAGEVYTDAVFLSEMLTFAGLCLPIVLIANLLILMGKSGLTSFFKFIPPFILLYSASVIFVMMGSGDLTSGGLVGDDSGMNYQTAAYCAAYALSLNLFNLTHPDMPKFRLFTKGLFSKWFWIVLLFIQCALLLTSGGRGGVVVAATSAAYCLWSARKHLEENFLTLFWLCVCLIIGIAATLLIIPRITEQTQMGSTGLNRILSFLTDPTDSGRSNLAAGSIKFFSCSPVFGHGAGSIFYEMGTYSHNLVLDILAEFGLIGLAVGIVSLVVSVNKLVRLIRIDDNFEIFAYLLIDAFTFLFFSSYWLVSGMLLFPVCFLLIIEIPKSQARRR